MAKFDAIVLGTGPSGEVCAGDLADGGMKVATVERELVSGECTFWACVPSKTLLRPGEALEAAREAPGAREAVTGELDAGQALDWRNFIVSDWDDSGQLPWLEEKGIGLLRGDGRPAGPGKLEVNGATHEAEGMVIARGSARVIPPIDGLADLDGIWTNRGATGAKEVPESLLILGGGPVGTELGQAFARMGAKVTIVEGDDRLLPHEAAEAGEGLGEALQKDGIEVRVGGVACS